MFELRIVGGSIRKPVDHTEEFDSVEAAWSAAGQITKACQYDLGYMRALGQHGNTDVLHSVETNAGLTYRVSVTGPDQVAGKPQTDR